MTLAVLAGLVGLMTLPLVDAASLLHLRDILDGPDIVERRAVIDPRSSMIVWATAALLGAVAWSARWSPTAPLSAAAGVAATWTALALFPDSVGRVGDSLEPLLWDDAFGHLLDVGFASGPVIVAVLLGSAAAVAPGGWPRSRTTGASLLTALAAPFLAGGTMLALDRCLANRHEEISWGSALGRELALLDASLGWAVVAAVLILLVAASARISVAGPLTAAAALLAAWVVVVTKAGDLTVAAVTRTDGVFGVFPGLGGYGITLGYLVFPLLAAVLLGTAASQIRRA
ncbi:hypothetical protein FE697_005910 [Mumia zhuanghuii]|uniref:Uncharacterized protein n=2 Tax=Mumia TaxID=1546255 RepID=A0ABW1QJ94_9ACTN|nr:MULTISPECIES: hypothetical protein [Mumia]KAA1425385.1 hypothetical protein FE697_005910 [Mumia zhuanghuii]